MMLPTKFIRTPHQLHPIPQGQHHLWRYGGLVFCLSLGMGLLPIAPNLHTRSTTEAQPGAKISEKISATPGLTLGLETVLKLGMGQPAIAVPAHQTLALETYPGESFAQLLQRAEDLAQMTTDTQFGNDITISQVSLVVMGVNDGLRSPLLSLDVSRSAWRSRSDIREHARYYTDARALLQLPLSEASNNTGTPAGNPGDSTGTSPSISGTPSTSTTTGAGGETGSDVFTASDLQITLQWTGTDDLNLAVSEPTGEIISVSNPAVASGGTLNLQGNTDCQPSASKPIEHVGWSTDRAPGGDYIATVYLANRCNAAQTQPITFTLTVQTPTGTRSWDGQVSEAQRYRAFPFTYRLP